tara:strand:+ start:299 stop:553 length:255 start_codon:yes stop_codon:yes gene_type:complete
MKDYTIYLKDEQNRIGVYLLPHDVKITSNSLFKIRIGYIDVEEKPNAFHCIDSSRMTLDVISSLALTWDEYNNNVIQKPWKEDA